MIAFMLVTVKILIGVVGKRIYGSVEKMLYVYDDLFEKRKQKLRELSEKPSPASERRKYQRREDRQPFQNTSLPIMGETRYQDEYFVEKYRAVKNGFIVDKPSLVRSIVEQNGDNPAEPAYDIEKLISFETLYLLSTLPPTDQESVLAQTLVGPALEALEAYAAYRRSSELAFDALDFYQKEKDRMMSRRQSILVRTGSTADDFSSLSPEVVTEYDPDLCEGIRIITANQCYDYGISRKELHCG